MKVDEYPNKHYYPHTYPMFSLHFFFSILVLEAFYLLDVWLFCMR